MLASLVKLQHICEVADILTGSIEPKLVIISLYVKQMTLRRQPKTPLLVLGEREVVREQMK